MDLMMNQLNFLTLLNLLSEWEDLHFTRATNSLNRRLVLKIAINELKNIENINAQKKISIDNFHANSSIRKSLDYLIICELIYKNKINKDKRIKSILMTDKLKSIIDSYHQYFEVQLSELINSQCSQCSQCSQLPATNSY